MLFVVKEQLNKFTLKGNMWWGCCDRKCLSPVQGRYLLVLLQQVHIIFQAAVHNSTPQKKDIIIIYLSKRYCIYRDLTRREQMQDVLMWKYFLGIVLS